MNTENELLAEIKKAGEITFLPYMCENAPSFGDIDKAIHLLGNGTVPHKQREIWKMMPKKDGKGNPERNEKTGAIIMIRVVTRNSKVVTVNVVDGGLASILPSGKVEPMDYNDVREVVELIEQQKQ